MIAAFESGLFVAIDMRTNFMDVAGRMLKVGIQLCAVYALWSFLGELAAPDACLDIGHGSFDYPDLAVFRSATAIH